MCTCSWSAKKSAKLIGLQYSVSCFTSEWWRLLRMLRSFFHLFTGSIDDTSGTVFSMAGWLLVSKFLPTNIQLQHHICLLLDRRRIDPICLRRATFLVCWLRCRSQLVGNKRTSGANKEPSENKSGLKEGSIEEGSLMEGQVQIYVKNEPTTKK